MPVNDIARAVPGGSSNDVLIEPVCRVDQASLDVVRRFPWRVNYRDVTL